MNPVVKILNTIGDVYTQGAKEILEEVGDVDYKILTQDNLLESIGEYEIAVIGLGLSFMKDVLEKAEKLKIIATATTGLDHIDVKFAKLKGITVLSLRGENDFLDTITGTAELAWGLLIDVVRLTPWAFDNVKEYKWEREKFRGHNLYGKTLGIVGMGRLGKWMARYGKAFGMNVLYCDPNINLSTSDVDRLWKRVEFGELLARVRALLRRPATLVGTEIKIKDLKIDLAKRRVFRGNREILLTSKEFLLLAYLGRNAGAVLTREQIIAHLWDFAYEVFSNLVDVHIKNLRKKIDPGAEQKLLETVRGAGYRLRSDK